MTLPEKQARFGNAGCDETRGNATGHTRHQAGMWPSTPLSIEL